MSSRILKTYSSSPYAKHRHQAATDSATKQQKDGKSAVHSYILLRSGTIHFKKRKSSDPEIFTTFSKYVGKKRKEKETKSHRDREKHRDKRITERRKVPCAIVDDHSRAASGIHGKNNNSNDNCRNPRQ
jgi:hypothetical protein